MTYWRKSGPLVTVWIKSLTATAWCSFCSGSRSCRVNFATTHFMQRSCVKITDTVIFGIPRSASSSLSVSFWSLLMAACTCSTLSGILLVVGLPQRGSLSTDFLAKCPSIDEWIKKLWYIYTMEYYLPIKKKEILPFVAAWMDMESVMLSEISQS